MHRTYSKKNFFFSIYYFEKCFFLHIFNVLYKGRQKKKMNQLCSDVDPDPQV